MKIGITERLIKLRSWKSKSNVTRQILMVLGSELE